MSAIRVARLSLMLLVGSVGWLSGCQNKDTSGISDMMVGAVCTTDDDCTGDLSCETQGKLIDGQCTMYCGDDADCLDELGPQSLCILSANRCVRRCVKRSDCPVFTYCSKDGWCIR